MRGQIGRVRGVWTALLTMWTPRGQRLGVREVRLRSAREPCAALDAPLSLVIALMVDFTRPEVRLVVRPLRPRPADGPWQAHFATTLSLASGLLPGVAPGARATAGVDPPGLTPVELVLTVSSGVTASAGGRRARFVARLFGFRLCPADLATGGLDVRICIGPDIGTLEATGLGGVQTRRAEGPLVNLAAGIELRLPIWESVALYLEGGLDVHFIRETFVFTEPDGDVVPVHRPSALVARGGVGVGVWLP